VEKLLDIVKAQPKQEFRQLAAEILYNLSASSEENRAILMANDANTVFLGLLNEEVVLLEQSLRILENQANMPESSRQVRTLGGIDRLLNMLQSRCIDVSDQVRADENMLHNEAVIIAGCDLLTQLAFDDDNSLHIRQMNGVHTLANLLLHGCRQVSVENEDAQSHFPAQVYVLRTLRFVFSLERNRKAFKRIFPTPALFELFIEIGQYERDLDKYMQLAKELMSLSSDKRAFMINSVKEMVDKDRVKTVRKYVVLGDAIGKGGFGTIYRCRREGGQDTQYALKEIPLREFGTLMTGSSADDAETHREVSLLQQIDHPNIVRYVESFTERDRDNGGCSCLYIVMELVEGTSLLELINSHAEKKQLIPERKIREIVVQILHALYYIHKKKSITHRDLTPSNILLRTEADVLTKETVLRPVLVDFGLARQRQSDHSVMASVVGTITYSCPEIIERRPYTDKADIWSLGVILYQLICLRNPFADSNPLQVLTRERASLDSRSIAPEHRGGRCVAAPPAEGFACAAAASAAAADCAADRGAGLHSDKNTHPSRIGRC
jgi:NIMA (never in mitosis gene a)-related kinase